MLSSKLSNTRGKVGAPPLSAPHASAKRHLCARKLRKTAKFGTFVQPELRRHEGPTHTTRVATESASQQQSDVQPVQQGTWHAVVANTDFMLHDVQNEAFAEQLRERKRLFQDKNKPIDFWLVSEPEWLDRLFPSEAKRVRRPCVALVSTDEIWMNFMKLRLDRVLRLELGEKSLEEVLKSNAPVPKYEPLDREGVWTAPYPPYRPGWWEVFMQK